MRITRKEYEELKKQFDELSKKLEEVEVEKFELEVPGDYKNMYVVSSTGFIGSTSCIPYVNEYLQGCIFRTEEEASRFVKERALLFKIKKWAEEYNKPSSGYDYPRYEITKLDGLYIKDTDYDIYRESFSIFPMFYTYDIADDFIDEFGEEILEVLT